MNAYRAKPLNFPWPPLVYGLAILTALLLDRISPPLLPRLDSSYLWYAGALLASVAVWLDVWAMTTLLEGKTTVMPYRCTAHLVTRGPFRFTRNPSYLGYTLITLSLALLTGNSWFLVAAVAAAVATDLVAIRHEELHLLSRFGCEFESYCRHTRRWL